MHLIDVRTLKLHAFYSDKVPQYAILSHTWSTDMDDEVTFHEMKSGMGLNKKGFAKIKRTCDRAIADGHHYAWVDTVCINKESSAELSEAINSMYEWYKNSEVCYVYLADVSERPEAYWREESHVDKFSTSRANWPTAMRHLSEARWFGRGWTLQELIAPRDVQFFDKGWHRMGNSKSLSLWLSAITGINQEIIEGEEWMVHRCSIAERMSWMSRRETTRIEDTAYCLLGLFTVHMAMLYGEGRKAFIRLQEEIMADSDDHSLFAWTRDKMSWHGSGLLAPSPRYFQNSYNIVPLQTYGPSLPFSKTNKGLRMRLRLRKLTDEGIYLTLLDCVDGSDGTVPNRICLYLKALLHDSADQFCRIHTDRISIHPYDQFPSARHTQLKHIFVKQRKSFEQDIFERDRARILRSPTPTYLEYFDQPSENRSDYKAPFPSEVFISEIWANSKIQYTQNLLHVAIREGGTCCAIELRHTFYLDLPVKLFFEIDKMDRLWSGVVLNDPRKIRLLYQDRASWSSSLMLGSYQTQYKMGDNIYEANVKFAPVLKGISLPVYISISKGDVLKVDIPREEPDQYLIKMKL